ncbi:hypothetical protein CYLTODRAFT_340398 [Cylindrobasidium torrendii FP15055 ss-10]|uniref:Adhesin domain-containing protein n=1 Tax=Cylindrobasidium torrendii FP15055 ss-10 TaxID=1314674 RepID=A0A0D7BV47_9AGAR|nr:hypothetical protein CYLTODRAFT_340398 [Cylindrobasidium torrendii FP15055 ss-10]
MDLFSSCLLVWKAIGVVFLCALVLGGIKLVLWAITPVDTGLEKMPAWSTSLGCLDAPLVMKGGKSTMKVPLGSHYEHAFDVRGDAVGTIFLTEGAADAKDVEYDILVSGNDQSLLDQVTIVDPLSDESTNSRLMMNTPWVEKGSPSCIRFDIVVRIPTGLKKLSIASHAVAQVQFDHSTQMHLDDLRVTLYAIDRRNMILPRDTVRADIMKLEVFRGWIVGDVNIVKSTTINTQRGNGIMNVRVHPVAGDSAAQLQTTTGAGRTDIFYIEDRVRQHRAIDSTHISSLNGEMYLTYKKAAFDGLVSLKSGAYTTTGLSELPQSSLEKEGLDEKWTHWAGSPEGADRLTISSRGWTGLYL